MACCRADPVNLTIYGIPTDSIGVLSEGALRAKWQPRQKSSGAILEQARHEIQPCAFPAEQRRDPQNRSGLAEKANPVCFGSGAEGTRTLDLLRDRQAL